MRYQAGTVAPYWIKTYVLRRKGLTPPQLYRFDQHTTQGSHSPDTEIEEMKV
jgi:hypothetical protein